jgi:tetratricopeptide (TPR) repeat protein/arylsulfatase A-like enzyme
VLFRNVYTPVPMTLPSHCSMMTGTLPPSHGVRDNLHKRLPDGSVTLAERLKAKGLATAAVVSSVVLDRRFNLSQGFDSYDDRFQAQHKIGDLAERKGDETTARATEWLASHASAPFFLFVHYYDPHDPYEPPAPFAAQWRDDPYSGEVAFADQGVGQLLEKLKQLGLYEQTLIVITGDHGEMLGEHGELNHGFFIYEAALKVPLILRVPGGPARQVEQAVSLIDVAPTVVALLGAPALEQAQGIDLSPLLTGSGGIDAGRPLYAETVTPTQYYGAGSLLGVIVDGWKLIETSRPELYDLRRDPGETANLGPGAGEPRRDAGQGAQTRRDDGGPESADGGDRASRRGRAPTLGVPRIPESRRERSRGGVRPQQGGCEGPDPVLPQGPAAVEAGGRHEVLGGEGALRRDAAERPHFADCHLQMSRIAAADGNPTAALAAARKALELSPDSEPAHLQLARLLRGQGDVEAAIAQYRRALASHPDSVDARLGLGRALAETGRFDDAVATLGPAAAARPDSAEAATQLGFALARQGKLDDAVSQYRRALSLAPDSPETHAYLGSALATLGKLDEAMPHFERALRARPEQAELHDWMGVALREKGNLDEAFGHFREAVRLDPRLAIAHFNLGRAYKQQGKLDDAVREYRRALALDPRLAAAHNSLGSVAGTQGRVGEAIQHFQDALRVEPNNAEAHNNLGLALRMLGRTDEALPPFQGRAAGPERLARADERDRLDRRDTSRRSRAQPGGGGAAGGACRGAFGTPRARGARHAGGAYAAAGDWGRATTTAEAAVALASARSSALRDEIARRLALYRSNQPYREPAGVRGGSFTR